MYTKKGISEIDLQTLRILYSVILHNIAPNIREMLEKDILGYEVQLYVPDLLEMMGIPKADINQNAINYAVAKIYSYHNILGIMEDSTRPGGLSSMYPVMLFHGYDKKKNVVRFASPYIGKVIQEVFGSSIRVNRHGSPRLKRNGQPLMLPSHSYLIKAELAKARNKRAAEIVCIVVAVIEQAGDNTPHIKASTIIERDPALQQSLEGKLTKDKNIVLKRAFSNAWKYLEKYTYLRERYKDIQLPSPSCYPTTSTLDMTFEFPHKGKC